MQRLSAQWEYRHFRAGRAFALPVPASWPPVASFVPLSLVPLSLLRVGNAVPGASSGAIRARLPGRSLSPAPHLPKPEPALLAPAWRAQDHARAPCGADQALTCQPLQHASRIHITRYNLWLYLLSGYRGIAGKWPRPPAEQLIATMISPKEQVRFLGGSASGITCAGIRTRRSLSRFA